MHLPASLVSCKSIYLTPTQTSCRASIRGTICPVSQSTHSHRSTKPQIRFCNSSAQNETGPPTSLFVLFRSGGPRVAWRLTSDEFRSRLNRVRREMSNYDFAHTPLLSLSCGAALLSLLLSPQTVGGCSILKLLRRNHAIRVRASLGLVTLASLHISSGEHS